MSRKVFVSRFCKDRTGSIGMILALFLTLSVGIGAIAVDIGSLYLERRTVQGATDLAAIAAAGDIDRADTAARATLVANGFDSIHTLVVTKGRYTFDTSILPGSRFEAGAQPPNAVRVDVMTGGQLHFGKALMSPPEIGVSAIATTDAQATFSIGSRLASVQGGLANAVLGALLGGNVSLSVMDYRALLDANVKLDSFMSALATEIGLTAGTYTDVLDSHATVGTVLRAVARAATKDGQSQAAQAVTTLLSRSSISTSVPLKALVDLGPLSQAEIGQSHAALGADLNVMSLVSAVAGLANGKNQVSVDLAGTIPGLLSLKVDLAIGEPAQHSGWVAVGQPGATVRTAQTRLRILAEVGGSGLLAGIRIRLPLYIELASAEARLKTLTCTAQSAIGQAMIEARPAVVKAWIGDIAVGNMSSFGSSLPVSRGSVVQAPLVRVTASAYAEMSNIRATDLSFSQSDVQSHVIKTAEVRDYASSLISSLLQSVDLQVDILGIGIGTGPAIKTLLKTLLTPVATGLDAILAPLFELIGLHLGQVDVQVNGLRCGGAVLAG